MNNHAFTYSHRLVLVRSGSVADSHLDGVCHLRAEGIVDGGSMRGL